MAAMPLVTLYKFTLASHDHEQQQQYQDKQLRTEGSFSSVTIAERNREREREVINGVVGSISRAFSGVPSAGFG